MMTLSKQRKFTFNSLLEYIRGSKCCIFKVRQYMSISVKRTVEDADADKPKKPRLEVRHYYITFLFLEIPYVRKELQCSLFMMLYLVSIGMDRVISEASYKGTILQRNNRKMIIKWSFSYNSFVKFHGTKIWEPHDCDISNSMLLRGM